LPPEARAKRLAELNAEIQQVERDHEALVVAAVEAGLTLAHLPTTEARLLAEQREREREDELRRQRLYQERVAAGADPIATERELFPPAPLRSAVVPAAMR
jgi:septal ring factor EnvC (AmiA/AmiB activator)